MKLMFFLAMICIGGYLYPQTATQLSQTGLEKFGYQELNVAVYLEGISLAGLTKERIATRTELQLRQTDIEPLKRPSSYPQLAIEVVVAGSAFSVEIAFVRWTSYRVEENTYEVLSDTWSRKNTGSHADKASFVMDSVDQLLDVFLNEYLATNKEIK
jgi:hypothetical protein